MTTITIDTAPRIISLNILFSKKITPNLKYTNTYEYFKQVMSFFICFKYNIFIT